MGFKYLVLGTRVGKALASKLLEYNDTEKVTLADMNYLEAEKAVIQISPKYPKNERCMPTTFNTEDLSPRDYARKFASYDVIASAIPARYPPQLVPHVIKAGKSFCDLGGVIEVTEKTLGLHTQAWAMGSRISLDNGIAPGTGNRRLAVYQS